MDSNPQSVPKTVHTLGFSRDASSIDEIIKKKRKTNLLKIFKIYIK